jgi:heterodisulfide reductase subunit C
MTAQVKSGFSADSMEAVYELLEACNLCYECTTCNSICPAFQTDPDKNPRVLIADLIEGRKTLAEVVRSAWWCCTCYSCEVYCPQGVPLTSLFYALKRASFEENREVPPNVTRAFELQATGYGFAFTSQIRKKRKALALPDMMAPDTEEIAALISSVLKRDRKAHGKI